MCGLFGFIDYKNTLSAKQKSCIIKVLAGESEARGSDATGIAYNLDGRIHIYKRALPAHRIHWCVPAQADVVMGHTRAATQGKAAHWQNNHPFCGKTQQGKFALAHNGVLWNDEQLRAKNKLPATNIKTDSYIAVQLIEQHGTLGFDSLKVMAEQLKGSFTFTVMDEQNNIYFVKGDSPMCIYRFKAGFYLYASTEQILQTAVKKLGLQRSPHTTIELTCGEILRIDSDGNMCCDKFDTANILSALNWRYYLESPAYPRHADPLRDLCYYAKSMGVSEEQVEELLMYGFDEGEIEELLYDPVMLGECLDGLRYEYKPGFCY